MRERMKILVMATSTITVGETILGLSLANQLKGCGFNFHFIVCELSVPLLATSMHSYTMIKKEIRGHAIKYIDNTINTIRPRIIVLCDYFVHCNIFAREFSVEPWFVYKYNIPIVPIDFWQFGITDFKIDVFGNQYIEVDNHVLDMPCVMHPVPLCSPKFSKDKRSYYFPLVGTKNKDSVASPKTIRHKLGLSDQDKVILLSLSHWQIQRYQVKHVDKIIEGIPVLISYYLRELPDNVYVLFFGGNECDLPHFPTHRILCLTSSEVEKFESLLASVDLLLTLNLPSTALVRAAHMGINSVVLSNRHYFVNAKDIEALNENCCDLPSSFMRAWIMKYLPIYPFRMWPLGWHNFLEPLVSNNPYLDTFLQVEILNERAVLEALEGLLFDSELNHDLESKREGYFAEMARMEGAAEVLTHIIRELNVNAN
jgi:hypothetical protein